MRELSLQILLNERIEYSRPFTTDTVDAAGSTTAIDGVIPDAVGETTFEAHPLNVGLYAKNVSNGIATYQIHTRAQLDELRNVVMPTLKAQGIKVRARTTNKDIAAQLRGENRTQTVGAKEAFVVHGKPTDSIDPFDRRTNIVEEGIRSSGINLAAVRAQLENNKTVKLRLDEHISEATLKAIYDLKKEFRATLSVNAANEAAKRAWIHAGGVSKPKTPSPIAQPVTVTPPSAPEKPKGLFRRMTSMFSWGSKS